MLRAGLAAGVLLASAQAAALPILIGTDDGGGVWSASDADGRAAQASFSLSGDLLTITLSNLSTDTGKIVPNEVLVGLVFGFGSDATLINPIGDGIVNVTAATIKNVNSNVVNLAHGSNLDGEYAYKEIDEAEGLGRYAISASAYDPLGINVEIDSSKAYSPDNVGGADFGIVNSSATKFANSITFWVADTLTIQLKTSDLAGVGDIDKVSFLYGTSYKDDVEVPEPATLALLGGSLLLVGLAGRRRKPKS